MPPTHFSSHRTPHNSPDSPPDSTPDSPSDSPSQLVIGAGEVGTALANVLGCDTRDIQPHTGTYQVLHICYPYSPRFVLLTSQYAAMHLAQVVVVHSTVPAGTCDPHGWLHSPIRGQHPWLEDGIRAFTKHIGGGTADQASLIRSVFTAAGVETFTHARAAETEVGKLVELARLGVEVRVEKEVYRLCRERGWDFDEVYGAFTTTYNEGYTNLGHPEYVKPRLRHMPGPLGGHCVGQNTPLLDSGFFTNLVHPITKEGWEPGWVGDRTSGVGGGLE